MCRSLIYYISHKNPTGLGPESILVGEHMEVQGSDPPRQVTEAQPLPPHLVLLISSIWIFLGIFITPFYNKLTNSK